MFGKATELIDQGMRAQLSAAAKARHSGAARIGWKVALNDAGVQKRLGITCSLVGTLAPPALAPGATYRPPRAGRPRLEAELGLRLSSSLPAGASLERAAATIAAVSPALEFVDASKPMTSLALMAESSFLHDAVLFGAEYEMQNAAHLGKDFPCVSRGEMVVAMPVAGRVPGDLAELVLHVANVLGRYGESLLAGDRVISGSYTDPIDIAPGDRITVDYGPLGELSVTIGEPRAS
jgi:2-keto-4-pentenoate hydratase